MRIPLDEVVPMGSAGQRAAAQTMLALVSIDADQLVADDPLEVRVTDSAMADDGSIEIHGQAVDVADALRAGATIMTTALSLLPAPTSLQLRRVVGVLVDWSEVLEEAG